MRPTQHFEKTHLEVRPLNVGEMVHIPDRIVNAWGTVLQVDGDLVRVQVKHGASTASRITWYRRADIFTAAEWRRRAVRQS